MNIDKRTEFIDAYLQKLNIRPARDGRQFVNVLCNKYDKRIVERIVKLIVERPDKTISENYEDDIYELKNYRFDFSVDFIRYNADLYHKYFQWFLSIEHINPKRILDIGCENGFITCFYGLVFPKAEIIGIDPCKNAINCAEEMAKKLKVKNVTFRKGNLMEAKKLFPPNTFDLVTSVMTFKEIIGSYIQKIIGTPEEYKYWSLHELDLGVGASQAKTFLDIVNALLTQNGQYISFERWFPEDTVWWADKLKASGLYVNWDQAEKIAFHEIGEPRVFPAIAADKRPKEYDYIKETTALWLRNEPDDEEKLMNLAAETAINNFPKKSFLKGLQCNYADSLLKVRYEFWLSDDKLLCYQCGNTGYRELRILPVQSGDSITKMI
ncbi:MAG TPA: methyltransferase domain-containing protein, partial [Desulfobacteria bacterium]|nr:methyltransferase domain-containing protein [Desulfobacteria bacterium]